MPIRYEIDADAGLIRVELSGPSFIELYGLATAKGQLPPDLRPTRAAVIVNQGWLFGIVRQFAALADRAGIRVMPFVDADQARQWLVRRAEPSMTARPTNEQA